MKLATLRSSRTEPDGTLVVVSRDLTRMTPAADIAPTLQAALEEWPEARARLEARFESLQSGKERNAAPFDPARALSPLPRAYQFVDSGSFMSHVRRVHKLMGKEPDARWGKEPFVYQAASDAFLAPCEDIPIADEAWNLDYEAEVAVITEAVPRGATVREARDRIALVLALNEVSLRGLAGDELSKGFGLFLAKPNAAFTPVAVTPDELGEGWRECRVHLPLRSEVNGERLGEPNGSESSFGFDQLIAHVTRTRRMHAGSIVSAGTVSNEAEERGVSCIMERRVIEQLAHGAPRTPWLRFGDRVRIDLLGADGRSMCGAIDQKVVRF